MSQAQQIQSHYRTKMLCLSLLETYKWYKISSEIKILIESWIMNDVTF